MGSPRDVVSIIVANETGELNGGEGGNALGVGEMVEGGFVELQPHSTLNSVSDTKFNLAYRSGHLTERAEVVANNRADTSRRNLLTQTENLSDITKSLSPVCVRSAYGPRLSAVGAASTGHRLATILASA